MSTKAIKIPIHDQAIHRIAGFTGAHKILLGIDEFRSLARRVSGLYAPRKLCTAIVANSDAGFGLARMYQELTDASDTEIVKVFRAREPALTWLGIDKSAIELIDFT